jgi:uncharacterized protein (TIGR04255 family)
MATPVHTIHDFKHPPVWETVLSVQFSPLRFSNLHSGLYWLKIRDEFPRSELRPPLAHIKEEFGFSEVKAATKISFDLNAHAEPQVRYWFLDKKGNKLLQVQNDRFVHNWQKVTGTEVYPRYETVRKTFQKEWEGYCEFLKEEKLGAPEVDQCEVTYINHIEYDKGWKPYAELNKVIAPWSGTYSGNFLEAPEKVSINVSYLLPEHQGRLHLSLGPVIRASDAKEVLQLILTARGAPATSENEDIYKWLDLGRKWIVKGFTDFTSAEIQKTWERIK